LLKINSQYLYTNKFKKIPKPKNKEKNIKNNNNNNNNNNNDDKLINCFKLFINNYKSKKRRKLA
jgi:hypothetical protein